MRIGVYIRFIAVFVAFITCIAAHNKSWASYGPDNTYCQAGNHPAFGSSDGPATLPQACIYTAESATPSPGKLISVAAGADLQTALDSAQCGDIVSIQPNASPVGGFRLPGNQCDDAHWITIRTAAPDSNLPPEGTRMTPCYAGVGSINGRPAYTCSTPQRVIPQILSPRAAPVFTLMNGASHYRFVGLEITRSPGTGFINELIAVDKNAQVTNIIVDRVWAHGSTQDDTTTAVGLDGMTFAAVIDSYLNDFHCTAQVGACTDSHAVAAGTSVYPGGPYKIVNNFLEASGENVMMGGGYATATPADIEIRRNHMFKPLIWMKGQPGFVGGKNGYPFVVLNLSELKNAQRVLFEGNIMENSWGGFSQTGAVMLLTPKNQFSKKQNKAICPDCQVIDITVRYSTMSHSGRGISIAAGLTGLPKAIYQAKAAARYSIHDITIDGIDAAKFSGGGSLFEIRNTWPKNGLNSVLIEHVTGFGDPNTTLLFLASPTTLPKIPNVGFTNNLVLSSRYPVWNDGGDNPCAVSVFPKDNLATCLDPYTFSTNGIIASPPQFPPSDWPSNNLFPATPEAVQFVNYNNGDGGDYHLLSTSPYKNAGSDGKDLGADINTIDTLTQGVD